MRNEFYFQIGVTDEQKQYAIQLVDYSIKYHHVPNVFDNDPYKKKRQREFRYTGTLGEVVFADAYGLPRPTRSFGAVDGQDFGQDFVLNVNGEDKSIDLKSMHRKNNNFHKDYVLNIPSYQLKKEFSKTDYYFCISFHNDGEHTIATFIGYVPKKEVLDGKIGDFFAEGTTRTRNDNTTFEFNIDTYEVKFEDITTPFLNEKIINNIFFKKKTLF